MKLPIEISDYAWAEIKKIIAAGNFNASTGLRIGVKGAGCSGTSFVIGIDTKHENDDAFQIENIPIYIDKKHFMYLIGMKIDFIEDNLQRGFTFVSK